ncbi:MAG: sugar transferase [Anaerolineales bacterium]
MSSRNFGTSPARRHESRRPARRTPRTGCRVPKTSPVLSRAFAGQARRFGLGAQINYGYYASVKAMAVKLEYDLYYIKHRSLPMDFQIILRTIGTMLRRTGR